MFRTSLFLMMVGSMLVGCVEPAGAGDFEGQIDRKVEIGVELATAATHPPKADADGKAEAAASVNYETSNEDVVVETPAAEPELASVQGKSANTKKAQSGNRLAVNKNQNKVAGSVVQSSFLSTGRAVAVPSQGSQKEHKKQSSESIPTGSPDKADEALDEPIRHDHSQLESTRCPVPVEVELGGGAVMTVRFGGRLDSREEQARRQNCKP